MFDLILAHYKQLLYSLFHINFAIQLIRIVPLGISSDIIPIKSVLEGFQQFVVLF